MSKRKRIGILTGGGDCPGINAVIRAVARKAMLEDDAEIIGIEDGYEGLVNNKYRKLRQADLSGILTLGGTILGASKKANPYRYAIKQGDKLIFKDLSSRALDNIERMELDCLVVIGGDGTLGIAYKLFKSGVPVIGVPKTIDNDLSCTDYTFGFDTALNIATECIDRLHTTAESHHRVMVVEVMGRHAGWIAIESGIAGGADVILIPEIPIDIEEVCGLIRKRHARGKTFSIVVVAEGAQFKEGTMVLQETKLDEFGHVRLGGIGENLGKEIEKMTGYETRVSVLGYIQRGGIPTAFDRVLGTRCGVKAVELIEQKKFGRMVALAGNKVIDVALEDAVKALKTVDMELYEIAKVFFG